MPDRYIPVEITSVEHFNSVIESSNLVLADFYADWCEPCKWLEKILTEMSLSMPENSLIIKSDIEKISGLQEDYQIMNVPVLILFKDGKPVWRMNGFLMGDELLKVIESFHPGTGIKNVSEN